MKTALITWNDRIAPVFDTAPEAVVVDIGPDQITGRRKISLPEGNAMDKIVALADAGVTTVICGAIANPSRHQAAAYGIRVFPFITGDTETVLRAWLADELDRAAFIMPGCGRRYGCCHRGGGRKQNCRCKL
ncbi:MAG: NifB/NifX family molybdenum-iron cluster-binding protein [Victivallales bacterium]|nr:NifB/NifX family molybdenum-iron cluster-binding protein [Victivallales bacterium]